MRRFVIFAVASTALVLGAYAVPARAADASAVLAACDRTPGCSYAPSKDGTIQGCSSQSGVCFNCEVDGKRECTQTLTRSGRGVFNRKGAGDGVLAR
jgi:hypothetical protein